MLTDNLQDFVDPGRVLLVDKPKTWTSFDVVNKIRFALRRSLGVKKIKVGHAGTLDPMATGLLILCTGKKTKTIAELQGLDKTYKGVFRLGATTPSYDAETEIDAHYPYTHIDEGEVVRIAKTFIGTSQQVPPMYSAIQKNGQRLYTLARKGISIEVPPREIHISTMEIANVDLPDVHFKVTCSKGTYIRSLAYDLGKALGSGAYLTELCRTRIGDHALENAHDVFDLVGHIEKNTP